MQMPTTSARSLSRLMLTMDQQHWRWELGNISSENGFFWISHNPHLSEKDKLTDMRSGRPTTLVLIWKDGRNRFKVTVWTHSSKLSRQISVNGKAENTQLFWNKDQESLKCHNNGARNLVVKGFLIVCGNIGLNWDDRNITKLLCSSQEIEKGKQFIALATETGR